MRATLATGDPTLVGFARLVGDEDPIVVEGSHTRWTVGGQPDPAARIVPAPEGIVEYAPEEMTVKVRAGTTVADLHAELGAFGQRTALPDRGGTVGGALAVGENDVRALGRGLVRNSLLQVRYVSAEGRIVTGGGPTVKNVSGFDLPRLMVGALGTLGLLAEVILRTNPIPPVSKWFAAEDADLRSVLDAVVAPSCVLLEGRKVWVELEGHGVDLDSQARELSAAGPFVEVASAGSDGLPLEPPPHRRRSAPYGVEVVGLGFGFGHEPETPRDLDPVVAELNSRIKDNFDPTGRLNPGRNAGRK